jgi:histidinol-phosphate/aromatic aminotransferase/cobyric acid decarboxylase-like protein
MSEPAGHLLQAQAPQVTHLGVGERVDVAASLAVCAWGRPGAPPLDLRYAPDEAELLEPSPSTIVAETFAGDPGNVHRLVEDYPVTDPYGARRGAPVLSALHQVSLAPEQVSFGAGVTGLLRDLAGLVSGNGVLAPELIHPDFEVWAMAAGRPVALAGEPVAPGELQSAVQALAPSVLHLDRPGFLGDPLELDELYALAQAAAAYGTLILVDESAATYLGAADSAVRLVASCENLLVLRGLTKAYSLGGLRAGYAVASPALARRVRNTITPMQISEISLALALRVLAAGDVLARLRTRIAAYRPATISLLTDVGIEVLASLPQLPWVIVRDPDGEVDRRLTAAGIRALGPALVPGTSRPDAQVLRLTIPLSEPRMLALRTRLEGLPR